ncbi:MAG: TIM barrel protein [Nitrospiraceae bacterium]|nr:TIM barrel protein [Nitrospiraceae bacterium]
MSEYRIGAQSFSFREFDFEGSIRCAKELGVTCMEYCNVHFPPDAGHEGFANIKARLEAEGIQTLCFGVEAFTGDAAVNRTKFEFAKALGIGVLTADCTPDSFDNLDDLVAEFDIKIAIHNHGPGARYDKAADTLDAIRSHSRMIGACVDTGHVIRSGECPHEVIQQLGPRTLSLHLKDWTPGGDEEILGEGALDMLAVARALKAVQFCGPIMMEYENSPQNPVPEMKIGLENWRSACEKA